MAITLRNVTGSALTFDQLDTNFSSYFYSASYSSGTITLFTTGSTEDGDIPAPASMSITIPTISQWEGSSAMTYTDSQVQISGSLVNGSGSISAPNDRFSHGEGYDTVATGLFSHAEGVGTQATATGSHAEGFGTIATASCAHSEGMSTTASGSYSHAEGFGTTAFGSYSHAEGSISKAKGEGSHAEGYNTQAIGDQSHAEGYSTVASGSYQHVQGQFNISSSAQSAFIIGNGSSDGSRSNLVFASGSTFQVTGSILSTIGFTGSLQGTSSYAITSSITEAVSGSTNYIPVFSGNRTLISSNIYQDGGGRIGIGTEPDESAALHVDSNGGKAGLLLPLATTGSVDTPVKGLMIYDDDASMVAIYTGTSWKYLQYEV